MHLTDISVFPLCRLKRCDLTLLRLRCLWWAVLVSVSLTVSPMQKVSFLQLYNMETFYLELLFLNGKTVYCRALCLWEGVRQQVHRALLGSVFLVSTGSKPLSSFETCALGVQYSPSALPCCAYERRGVST